MHHPALGRLRNQSPPETRQLDRLSALCPTWRVHWFPQTTPAGDPRWVLAEHAPNAGDAFYREVGKWRLERLEARERAKTEHRSQWFADDPIVPYGCELMLDGGIVLGMYEPAEAWTDGWWVEVTQMLAFTRDHKPRIQQAEVDQRYKAVSEEVLSNEQYLAYWWDRCENDPQLKAEVDAMDQEAKEAIAYHHKGRRSVVYGG